MDDIEQEKHRATKLFPIIFHSERFAIFNFSILACRQMRLEMTNAYTIFNSISDIKVHIFQEAKLKLRP